MIYNTIQNLVLTINYCKYNHFYFNGAKLLFFSYLSKLSTNKKFSKRLLLQHLSKINSMNKISHRLWSFWRILLVALILVALAISTILSWHYITGGAMAGCGGGSPCSNVLGSSWSTLAGIFPVSGLALGMYFAMLVAVFFIGADTEISVRRMAWSAILVLSGAVAGSAIWFMVIQKRFIGEFCPYCMTAHITGLFITVLVIWRSFNEFESLSHESNITLHSRKRLIRPFQTIILIFSGLTLAGILAAIQVSFMSFAVNQGGRLPESHAIIDYQDAPMIGSPDAPYVVTVLFDYQCPHCQKIHFMLENAVRLYEGKLAFLLCPTPLSSTCNPYILHDVEAFRNSCDLARIGLTIWFANRGAFAEFENWMFSFDTGDRWIPRSLEMARTKAVELIGQNEFDTVWADPRIEQYLQKSISIYGNTIQGGISGIPKMIYSSHWVIPEPYNVEELVLILQESLAVPLL